MDSRRFGDLVLSPEYSDAMYRVARSFFNTDEDAADAVSECILRAFKNLDSLKNQKYFKTWLTRILINVCKEMLRKKREDVYLEDCAALADKISADRPGTEDELVQRDSFARMMECITDKNRSAMVLYYGEEFKTSEIAEMLEISEAAVRQRLARGRREAQEYLKRQG